MHGVIRMVGAICLCAWGNSAFGIIITKQAHEGLRVAMDDLSVQQPSQDREDRWSYRATLRMRAPLFPELRLDSSIYAAPDVDKKSQRVTADHDLYGASLTLAVAFPALFRFGIGVGPTISYERSTLAIAGDRETVSFVDYGVLLRGDADYAITKDIEANFSLALQNRTRSKKFDWSYGFGGGWNF